MSIWTLSRYLHHLFLGFTLGGLAIVVTDPMVYMTRPELTRIALVSAVRQFLLRNWQHPKILCRFSDSNCVLFYHGAGFDEGGTDGTLVVTL